MDSIDDLLGHNLETNRFGMYSDEGSAVVRDMVTEMVKNFEDGTDAATIAAIMTATRYEIEKSHSEVFDTAVRESVLGYFEHHVSVTKGEYVAQVFTDKVAARLG